MRDRAGIIAVTPRGARRAKQPGDVERFAPDEHGPLLGYEHVHRYALAARAVAGQRVLDLASGSGYGGRILRAARADVFCVDLNRQIPRCSARGVCGRAEHLPFRDCSFDAVVCFEAIEHIVDPVDVVDEIARVLRGTGIALISTPDRRIYTDRAGNRNPHHLSEMSHDEFKALLSERFPHVALYGQSVWAGSWLARLDAVGSAPGPGPRRASAALDPLDVPTAAQQPAAWVDPKDAAFPTPLFLVAACARTEAAARRLQRRLGSESVLHDPAQRLLGDYLRSLRDLLRRDNEFGELSAHAGNLRQLLEERETQLASLELHCGNLERLLAERDESLVGARAHAGNLERTLGERGEDLAGLQAHAENLERMLGERGEDLVGLQAHAENLERMLGERGEDLTEVRAHAGNLERALTERAEHLENLEVHVRNLEQLSDQREEQLTSVRAHADNLERLLSQTEVQMRNVEAHARNLEQMVGERAEQLAHAEGHSRRLEERCAALDAERNRLSSESDELRGSLQESLDQLVRIRESRWFRTLLRLRLIEKERGNR